VHERERIHSRTLTLAGWRRILPQSIRVIPPEYALDDSSRRFARQIIVADDDQRDLAPYRRSRPPHKGVTT
jgi:hypothetical protein